jgi:ADP-ribose pyrophosphatase YjhB (NUDIX family)
MKHSLWRPRQSIRSIAVAVIQKEGRLLLMDVKGDDGQHKGWRPLGGEIEFGETAQDAVTRELLEETGLSIEVNRHIGVLENIYRYEGTKGHEMVFIFEAHLTDAVINLDAKIEFLDGGVENCARWVPLDYFRLHTSELFPAKLAGFLNIQ